MSLYLSKPLSIRAETFGGVAYLHSDRSYSHLNEAAFEILSFVACHPGIAELELLEQVPPEFQVGVQESISDWLNIGLLTTDPCQGGGIVHPSQPTRDDILCAPLEVNFNATGCCNQECIFCSAANFMSDRLPDMTKAQVEQFIEQLYELGVLRLYFVGGEPMLFRWIDRLLEGAQEAHLCPGMTSNGTAATTERYVQVADYLVDITFSIHSPIAEQHDTLVRQKGAFRQAWQNMLAVKKAGHDVYISTLVLRQNAEHIFDWVKKLIDTEVKEVILLHSFPIGNMVGKKEWVLSDREFTKLGRKAEALGLGTKTSVRAVMAHDFYYADAWPPVTELDQYLGIHCTGGRRGVTINSNGDIHPCDFLMTPTWRTGNVFIEGLKQTWDRSPLLDRLRTIEQPTKCQSCALFIPCNGGCPARAYAEGESDDLLPGWDCPMSPRFSGADISQRI